MKTTARQQDSHAMEEIVLSVRALRRHTTTVYEFPHDRFYEVFKDLFELLDDIAEFIYLDASNPSFILKIRHR